MCRSRAPLLAGLCLTLWVCLPIATRAAVRTIPATPLAIRTYAHVLRRFNPQLPSWQSEDLARHLLSSASKWKIDTNMLAAIVTVESSWHTHALSSAGAIGLGQLMPGTAATLGVDPHNPAQNLAGAAKYLRGLLETFGSNPHRYELTFAAYNAGPKAVERYGGVPPYYETQRYVVKVLRAWNELNHTVRLPKRALEFAELPHSPDIDYWLRDEPR